MNSVFVDSLYFIAVTRPNDAWKLAARDARQKLGDVALVTTDEVLTEYLSAFANHNAYLRQAALKTVQNILADPVYEVIPQSRDTFLGAIAFYGNRLGRKYSLVDCRSMQVMKSRDIAKVLTNDQHFVQEGFQVLIPAA